MYRDNGSTWDTLSVGVGAIAITRPWDSAVRWESVGASTVSAERPA